MAGMLRTLLDGSVICASHGYSHAQDVHVYLAADHLRSFTKPYLSPSGGTFGFRFPVERVAVEMGSSLGWFGTAGAPDLERRTVGTATITYAFHLNDGWRWEAGISSGYGSRYIQRRGIPGPWLDQKYIPLAVMAAIRNTRSEWFQPFLSIHPGYEHVLPEVIEPWVPSVYPDGVWAIMIRSGVSIALPNDPERKSW
jgi:hypothetical protein